MERWPIHTFGQHAGLRITRRESAAPFASKEDVGSCRDQARSGLVQEPPDSDAIREVDAGRLGDPSGDV